VYLEIMLYSTLMSTCTGVLSLVPLISPATQCGLVDPSTHTNLSYSMLTKI